MFVLKPLTNDCEYFILGHVSEGMRQGSDIIIEFNRVREAIAALEAAEILK